MLSFFMKKKHSPDTPPEEIIQGPDAQPNNGADDFIFVEKKPSADSGPLYPPMPQYPGLPYPPPAGAAAVAKPSDSNTPVPYVQGVPFKLAPELCPKSTFELTQSQVDGILAAMTRQTSLNETQDYNFILERSIQNESI